ncbi:glycosyltransferase family 4 protein, partial [Flavobacteriaceae bacterium]|nr:glycosyltransferase family 4 protein [Flavobacteriaceae bacterium]
MTLVIVSCPSKFWAFNLAEQLDERGMLATLFTVYHEKKTPLFAKFNSRVDNENISLNRIHTRPFLSVLYKLGKSDLAVKLFDKHVASQLKKIDFEVIICWAGLSIETVKEAKRLGKKVILERASVHLEEQQRMLKGEYSKFGKKFIVKNNALIQEKIEYQIADFISVPSNYVRDSFIDNGFLKERILVNGLGASQEFLNAKIGKPINNNKIQIIFFGSIIIRKGISYLIQAVRLLNKKNINVECYVVGKLSKESNLILENLPDNIKVLDFMPHKELSRFISNKDIAVFPSIEDGYG